jgi:hypothetical protein
MNGKWNFSFIKKIFGVQLKKFNDKYLLNHKQFNQ